MSSSLVPLGLRAYGVLQTVQGAWMLTSPGSFFDEVGPFGARNDHYIRDASTWSLALGVLCLLAAARQSWRLPVLALAALQAGMHAVNHIFDADLADPAWVGTFDAVSLLVLTGLLAVLTRDAMRTEVAR
jgi:hypothetical protein